MCLYWWHHWSTKRKVFEQQTLTNNNRKINIYTKSNLHLNIYLIRWEIFSCLNNDVVEMSDKRFESCFACLCIHLPVACICYCYCWIEMKQATYKILCVYIFCKEVTEVFHFDHYFISDSIVNDSAHLSRMPSYKNELWLRNKWHSIWGDRQR